MKKSFVLALVVAAAFSAPQISRAQGTATPAGEGRFYIELKDAPLSDALEMIFKAAAVPSFSIAEEAKAINIAPITFQNVQWATAVRQLANSNGFFLQRDAETGAYKVNPRQPAAGAADNPFATPPGGLPVNPFGGGRPGMNRPTLNGTPPVTRTNRQTTPGRGGRGGATSTPSTPRDPNAVYRILPVQHVYVGGIARLFEKAQIIDSTGFLVPQSNSGFGGGGQGGGGFGGGGFGGGQQGGGFGGGGFGGGQQGGIGGFGGGMMGGF
ncbi:MAG TPA: hypothetical protein VF681_06120 [Abditibacteriaceae bacterium]